MKEYDIVIEEGHNPINDRIFNFLLPRLVGNVLDVGCNTGYLISEYERINQSSPARSLEFRAVGIDSSPIMVKKAQEKGLKVILGDATNLPFPDDAFDTVVLSCVLEQIEHWEAALEEALRVGKRVIGVNPVPGQGQWGNKKGWVKSLIDPVYLSMTYDMAIIYLDRDRYYFEIDNLDKAYL